MPDQIHVRLDLSADEPNSVTYADTFDGLDSVWYRFSASPDGSVELWATPDGFEHLARLFLKLARGNKVAGYHGHSPLEFGMEPSYGDGPELTIGVVESRADVV
jgi:hypothetical protein